MEESPRNVPRVGDLGVEYPSRLSPDLPSPSSHVAVGGHHRAKLVLVMAVAGGGIPSLSWIGGGHWIPGARGGDSRSGQRRLVARRQRAWCGCGSRRREVVVWPGNWLQRWGSETSSSRSADRPSKIHLTQTL